MFVLVGIGSDSRLVKLCIFGAANSGILKIPIRVWSSAPWSPTGLTFEERRLELQIAALSLFGCLWVLAGTGSKSSPSVAFARFVVRQCLCCLWFPLSFCRFGYWAGLVSNVTQGKSKVAVALCGAQQQRRTRSGSTARTASLHTKTRWRTWSEKAEFPSESLAGWFHFRWLLFDLGRHLLRRTTCKCWCDFLFPKFSLSQILWIFYLRDNSVYCVLWHWRTPGQDQETFPSGKVHQMSEVTIFTSVSLVPSTLWDAAP